ncbi:Gfo/Idh/MocA family protein [Chloroflexota bacterium]
MKKEIRVGSIGAGQVFQRFSQGVEEANLIYGTNLVIKALADVKFPETPSIIERFIIDSKWAENPDPDKLPPEMESFLQQIDALYIASPNNLHSGYIRCALSNNKYTLCTKPLTESYLTSKELAKRLYKDYPNISFGPEQKGKALFMYEDHYLYYDVSVTLFGAQKELEKLVYNLGEPVSVEAAFIEKAGLSRTEPDRIKWLLNPAVSGGGVWIDTGIHLIRLMHQLGSEIDILEAIAELAPGMKAEKKMVVSARLNVKGNETKNPLIHWNNTPCRLYVEKDAEISRKEINIYFKQGMLTLNFGEGKIVREEHGQVSTMNIPSNPYLNVARVFYNLITEIEDGRLAGLSDAVEDMKVIEKVYDKAGLLYRVGE